MSSSGRLSSWRWWQWRWRRRDLPAKVFRSPDDDEASAAVEGALRAAVSTPLPLPAPLATVVADDEAELEWEALLLCLLEDSPGELDLASDWRREAVAVAVAVSSEEEGRAWSANRACSLRTPMWTQKEE